jgi:type I restriction enzyme R subunit
MDRILVLEKRTELVARKISEYLAATDPYAKTIVFCDDIDHAERMRQPWSISTRSGSRKTAST